MFRNYKKFSSELFIKDILACDCIYDTSWDSSLLEANGMSLKTFLLRSVIFMLHYTVLN